MMAIPAILAIVAMKKGRLPPALGLNQVFTESLRVLHGSPCAQRQ